MFTYTSVETRQPSHLHYLSGIAIPRYIILDRALKASLTDPQSGVFEAIRLKKPLFLGADKFATGLS
jgi:hypothetical protein